MEDKKYDILLEAVRKVDKRIDDLEKVTNAIKKDIGDDRTKIDDVVLEQSKLSESFKIMREDTNNLSKKTESVVKDAMNTVMQPAIDSVDSLKEEIKNKKTMVIKTNWFKSIFK